VPRTKTQTDEQVLDAALALAQESGISSLTFAALARRSGLSSATLVQRFANKATLTQRTLLHAWDLLGVMTTELASTVPRTPDGAVVLLVGLSQQYGDARSYGNGLLMLREDVSSPTLRQRGIEWESELTAALEARFASIPDAPAGIGYALAAFWQGAITWWAFRADQPLSDYLTAKLNDFLEAFPQLSAHALAGRDRGHRMCDSPRAWPAKSLSISGILSPASTTTTPNS
jgi:AcrR family transcriptional regulator